VFDQEESWRRRRGRLFDSAFVLRTATRQIRVLTVDEHQPIQEGLAAMINREDDMTVVAAAYSGEEAIAGIRRHRPDVVTLDLLLPDMPSRRNVGMQTEDDPDDWPVNCTTPINPTRFVSPDSSMYNAPHKKRSGLVYYMHDASAEFRFRLAGDLSRETTQDLEQARQTASSVLGLRCLVVDLTGLISIDAAGRELLKDWQAIGAQMTVISTEEQARIQLMTGVPVTVVGTKAGASKWLPPQAAALLLAALLALLLAATAVAAHSTQSARKRPQSVAMPASATIRAPISDLRSVTLFTLLTRPSKAGRGCRWPWKDAGRGSLLPEEEMAAAG
jgi:ABC-type transporter Mla MlaB component